jgi:hypothetical protein
MAAGVLFVATAFLPTGSMEEPPYSFSDYLFVYAYGLGSLLLLGGLLALRARHAGVPGWPERGSGFALAFYGTLVSAVLAPLSLTVEGIAGRELPTVVGFIVLFELLGLLVAEMGMLLLGNATLGARAMAMPWRALPMAIFLSGLPLAVLILIFTRGSVPWTSPLWGAPELLIGICWVLLGYALWSDARSQDQSAGSSRILAEVEE